jgi:hypothetical protein
MLKQVKTIFSLTIYSQILLYLLRKCFVCIYRRNLHINFNRTQKKAWKTCFSK